MEPKDGPIVLSEPYLTKFQLQEACRVHTGVYHIHAKNDSGSDEAELELVVLGECYVIFDGW